MKRLFGLLLLIGMISCSDEPVKTPRPKVVPKDSLSTANATANPYAPIDVSPMDMSYLPADYPKLAVKRPLPVARVIYSRPHRQGRKVFGSLVKYGEPWRLGANEVTEIEFFIPVTIQNKKIAKGRYVLYCIPQADKWTIVFNRNLNSWGLSFDISKDLYRFDIPVQDRPQMLEYFSMVFQHTATGADLVMAWENVEARLPIQYTED